MTYVPASLPDPQVRKDTSESALKALSEMAVHTNYPAEIRYRAASTILSYTKDVDIADIIDAYAELKKGTPAQP